MMGNTPADSPPPTYTEATNFSSQDDSINDNSHYTESDNVNINSNAKPPDFFIRDARPYHSVSPRNRESGLVTLTLALSRDPVYLENFITALSGVPPRVLISIRGVHEEKQPQSNDSQKTDSSSKTDFDFKIDITSMLLRWDPAAAEEGWYSTTCVSDDDETKAYRGGRWKSRTANNHHNKKKATNSGNRGPSALEDNADDTPDGADEENIPIIRVEDGEGYEESYGSGSMLGTWCMRFCQNPAPVKSFTYKRYLSGFDIGPVRDAIRSHLRNVNYGGDIIVELVLANSKIVVYSPHWVNRLRTNRFIFWACIILQLWIVLWPVIWFLERKYEVVQSEWVSSRNGLCHGQSRRFARGVDEAGVAEFWAPVVTQAAWEGQLGGCVLGEQQIAQLRRRETGRREMMRNGNGVVDWIERSRMMLGVANGNHGNVGGWTRPSWNFFG